MSDEKVTETTTTEETTTMVPEVLETREAHRISGTPDAVPARKVTTTVTETDEG